MKNQTFKCDKLKFKLGIALSIRVKLKDFCQILGVSIYVVKVSTKTENSYTAEACFSGQDIQKVFD